MKEEIAGFAADRSFTLLLGRIPPPDWTVGLVVVVVVVELDFDESL
jgi:hypothetical protein